MSLVLKAARGHPGPAWPSCSSCQIGSRDGDVPMCSVSMSVLNPEVLGVLFPIRKKELLSRGDLELPWRPLYEMLERILYSKTEHLGLNWFPK